MVTPDKMSTLHFSMERILCRVPVVSKWVAGYSVQCLAFLQKLDSWPTTDLQQSGSSSGNSTGTTAISPAQFYTHRDHVFGGSLSKLDRMRSHPDSFVMESLDETEEQESPAAKGKNCAENVAIPTSHNSKRPPLQRACHSAMTDDMCMVSILQLSIFVCVPRFREGGFWH